MKQKEFYSQYTAEQIENTLVRSNEKPFVIYQDVDNECYRFFVDQEKADAWIAEYQAAMDEGRLMDETIKAYEFPGVYIPGSPNYSAEFLNVEGDGVSNIEGSTENIIRFRPIIYNRAKENTEEMIEYNISISNGGNSKPSIYNFVKSGELVEINISDYISLGDNDISINIKGRASGTSKMINMRYNVFRLNIESNFNISKIIEPNKNFSINYSVLGTGQKDVYFYIDGIIAANHTINANDPNATLTQIITNSDGKYNPGKHTLQIYAVANNYSSDLLYYEFVIGGISNIFTTCLVSNRFPSGTEPFSGNAPGFKGVLYVAQKLNWAYYSNDSSVRNPKITWRLYDSNGAETHITTRTADIVDAEIDKMPDPIEFMSTGYGQYMLLALIEDYDYVMPNAHTESVNGHTDPKGLIACYGIWIDKNSLVQEAVNNLELKYSGLGRSNDEPASTRLDLSYNGITAQFYNFAWNNRVGYLDNAIVTEGNAYWTIPLNPFDQDHDILENGNTIEIDFETDAIRDESKPLFLIGSLDGLHLAIYATRAELKTSTNVGPTIRFRGHERHRLSFVTYPDTALVGNQRRFMMLYLDGIRSAVVQYPNTENMLMSGTNITIGNTEGIAQFKLYNLRVYRSVLQSYNILNNYIIDSGSNISALVKRNDIYVEGSRDRINVDKLKSVLPVWQLTGPFDRTLLPSQDKTAFTGYGIYTDTEHPDLYLEGAELEFKPSGESSLSDRMAKGIHIKFNKGSNKIYNNEGKQWNGNRWTPFKGNAPERKIRINADGLESSHVHNMLLENTINTVFPKVAIGGEYVLRTPALEYALNQYSKDMANKFGGDPSDYPFPYKINYASDWKPVVVVWRPNESTQYQLLGIYSMGEEKKADFAHGRRSIYLKKLDNGTLDPFDMYSGVKGDRGFDNSGIMQFEMVRDSELTLMTDVSSWDAQHEKDMEKVYQDDDDDASPEETAMQWLTYKEEVIKPFADLYTHCEKVNGIPYMKGNQEGFHNLLFSGKFNVWSFCAARIIIRRCGLTDTYVRNSLWVRFPKQFTGNNRDFQWWFAYWDLDMAFGLQQPSGALIIPPGSDREDKIGDNFVFTGKRIEKPEGSWFWDAFDEEIRLGKLKIVDASGLDDAALNAARNENLYYMMLQMENALANAGFTVDQLLKDADAIIDKYGEALYNADGQSKYIDSFGTGADYLLRLQGSRKSHLHWWAHESFERWDSEMVTSNYQANAVALRVTQNDPNAEIKIKAGGHSFFGWGLTTTVFESGVEHNTGDVFAFRIGRSLNGNDPVQIYSPNKIEELDCSSFADRIGGNIELAALVNKNTGTTIRKINIGVPKYSEKFNEFDGKTWTGIDALSTVEEFNIQGYRYVSQTGTLEFSGNQLNKTKGMTSLSKLYAAGATGLTSLQPAAGVHIIDYQLPTTIQSLVLVDDTIDINGITWWDDWTQVALPTTLKTLQMSGMGDDAGAHQLFIEYLTMLSDLTEELRLQYKLNYSQINIKDLPIELILVIAKMKINLGSSINITGYIHCNTEYTPSLMEVLMRAFGENCFDSTNYIQFDCKSERLIVSATGTDTKVYTENNNTVIEVKQGSLSILTAIGFGASSVDASNSWSIVTGINDFVTGIPEAPMINLDVNGNFLLHYTTGHLIAKECTESNKDYNVYVESTNMATGSAILRIIRRTYPTTANVYFLKSAQSVDYINNMLQLTLIGSYIFLADHSPSGYDGTMKNVDGGIWTLECDKTIADKTSMEYIDGHTEFDQCCIQIKKLPEEEEIVKLRYTSNWKGGKTIVASPVEFAIVGIIEGVLTPSGTIGNPLLYIALNETGVSHSLNSFSNVDLKLIIGDLNITQLIENAGGDVNKLYDIKSGPNKMYDIINFLKNITSLTINNAVNFIGVVDISKHKRCKIVNLENTFIHCIF